MIRTILLCFASISVACIAFAAPYVAPTSYGIDAPNFRGDDGTHCLSIAKGTSVTCKPRSCMAASGFYMVSIPCIINGIPVTTIHREDYNHCRHLADFDTLECRNSSIFYQVCVGRLDKPCVTGEYFWCDAGEPCWLGEHVATQVITTYCCRVTDVRDE